MSNFTARFERLELKFLVDELQARRVRDAIHPFCVADAHCPRTGGQLRGYEIQSLYLDSPGLAFHEAKERGDPDRLKLRIRTYSDTSPATFEVKRRHRHVIEKTRAVVPRAATERAALGEIGEAETQSGWKVLQDFGQISARAGALPTLAIRYEREAYESVVDAYARVTFDRTIAAARTSDWSLVPDPDAWCSFDEHWRTDHPTTPVVMEIKCEVAIPAWVTDLVRTQELVQTSFSKYSVGVHVTSWQRGRPRSSSRSAKVLGAV